MRPHKQQSLGRPQATSPGVAASVSTAVVDAHCTAAPTGSLQNWPNAPTTWPGGGRGAVGEGVGGGGAAVVSAVGDLQSGNVGGGAVVGDLQIGNEGGGVGAAVVGAVGTIDCGDRVGIEEGLAVDGGAEGTAVVGTDDGERVGTTEGRPVVGGNVGIRGAGILNKSQPQPLDDHSILKAPKHSECTQNHR